VARGLARGGLMLAAFGVLAVTACDAGTPDAVAPTSVASRPAGGAASTPAGAGVLGDAGTPKTPSSPTPSGSPKPSGDTAAQALPDGTHHGYVSKVDVAKRTLVLDKAELLTGEAARKAYQKENPGSTDGPPNDYFLVNDNPLVRTLPVGAGVTVAVIDVGKGDSVTPSKSTFAKLPAFLAVKENSTLFKLTVKGGKVTALKSVYLP
jgi:hypothetical protein